MRRGTVFVTALMMSACGSGSEEKLPFTLIPTCLVQPEPAERVFRTQQEWTAVHQANGREPAPAVDFTRQQVAARFDGGGSACVTFSVQRVTAADEEILVEATRHVSTAPCILILAYPQVVVSMPRRDEPVRFRIREIHGESTGPARACY